MVALRPRPETPVSRIVPPCRELLRPDLRVGWLYFIGPHEKLPIKIGFTVRVEGRIGSVQLGCWEELVCHGAVAATRDDEMDVHRHLGPHRIRGEWFEREPALELLRKLEAAA